MIEREIKHIKFSKSEIKKMRGEIAEMIKQGRRDKIPVYHIELDPSARKFVNLNHILFLPDGYIHGKEKPPRAISGWIVDPEGNKVLPAFVKIQKIVSPSKYATQLTIPGIQIAEKGFGRERATIQVDAGYNSSFEDWKEWEKYYAAEAWRIQKVLPLNKLSLRERILAKILGAEEISDVHEYNTLRKTYDFLMRPRNRLWRGILVNLLYWEGMDGEGIEPPRAKVNPWAVMWAVDKEDLARARRAVGAGDDPYARALANVERKVENYGRKAEKGKLYETGAIINVEEARIGMLKAVLMKYRKLLEEKGYK